MRKSSQSNIEEAANIHDLHGKKDFFLIFALIIAGGITTAFFLGFETKPIDSSKLQDLRVNLLQESMAREN